MRGGYGTHFRHFCSGLNYVPVSRLYATKARAFMRTIPPAVRILPMDSKNEPGFVGCSAEEIQRQFFLKELVRPGRSPGRYAYRKVGLRAEPEQAVLFQYDGRIIASRRPQKR